MNLTDLNQEERDALTRTVAEITASGGQTTAEQLLNENGTNYVTARVEHYYQLAVQRVATLWRTKSYEERIALKAQLEN